MILKIENEIRTPLRNKPKICPWENRNKKVANAPPGPPNSFVGAQNLSIQQELFPFDLNEFLLPSV